MPERGQLLLLALLLLLQMLRGMLLLLLLLQRLLRSWLAGPKSTGSGLPFAGHLVWVASASAWMPKMSSTEGVKPL